MQHGPCPRSVWIDPLSENAAVRVTDDSPRRSVGRIGRNLDLNAKEAGRRPNVREFPINPSVFHG